MKNTQTKKSHNLLMLLKKRVEQNYADFKAETLMLDEEELFESAHRIAAVRDAYEQISNGGADYLDEGEVAFLLKFYNPLEITADYLQERQAGYPVEIDEALMERFNADNYEENYQVAALFKPLGFDEASFFIYEDGEEGCF